MHSPTLALALLTLTPLTLAANEPQLRFFIPGLSPTRPTGASVSPLNPPASIITATSSTTVLALSCPTNAPPSECEDLTLSLISSSIYELALSAQSVGYTCTSKGDMTCTAAMAVEVTDAGEFSVGSDGMARVTTVLRSGEVMWVTARVTAGAEKLGSMGSSGMLMETGSSGPAATDSSAAKETGSSTMEMSKGSSTTETAGPTGTGSAPAGQGTPGMGARLGVEGAALVGLVGAALVFGL